MNSQKGFGSIIIILIIIAVFGAGAGGYVYISKKNQAKPVPVGAPVESDVTEDMSQQPIVTPSSVTETGNVSVALPDYYISRSGLSSGEVEVSVGQPVVFSAVVVNQGGKTKNSSVVRLGISYGSASAGGTRVIKLDKIIEPMTENGKQEIKWEWTPTAKTGYTYEFCADVGSAVAESNEENNCAKQASFNATFPLPDFTVSLVNISPLNIEAGEEINFTAHIQNSGTASKESIKVRLRIDINNDGIWDVVPADISLSDPASQSSYSSGGRWEKVWKTTSGIHRYEACVDATNDIKEIDETNNCASKNFTVK